MLSYGSSVNAAGRNVSCYNRLRKEFVICLPCNPVIAFHGYTRESNERTCVSRDVNMCIKRCVDNLGGSSILVAQTQYNVHQQLTE